MSQLMSIESQPKTRMQWNHQLWTARQAAWTDLNTKLLALQNSANSLINPATWDMSGFTAGPPGSWGATSGDPSKFSATVTGTPTAGTHSIDVLQLAQSEIDLSSGNLGPATIGKRMTGTWYESGGAGNVIEGNENITALRTSSGASMGLNTNSTITMNYSVNGVAQTATFKVNTVANGGNGTTMTDFTAWVASTIGNGATAQILPGASGANAGKLEVTTAAGTANELTAMSFTAKNAAGTSLNNFNTSVGAASATSLAASDGGVSAAETLTITGGTGTWNVALAAGDQKQDIVNKINATAGIGVIATLVGSNIQLRSNTTGADQAFTVSSSGTTAAMLNFAETQAAQDAQYTVNGSAFSSNTNNNIAGTGVLDGITYNLLGLTSTTLTIAQSAGSGGSSQDQWVTATKAKVKEFVNAYNAVLDLVYQKTQGESKVINPKTLGEYLQGPVSRDVSYSGVAFELRQLAGDVNTAMPAGMSMLSEVGITGAFSIGGGAANGRLSIDDAKLDAALRANPTQVQDLLGRVSGSPGIASDDGIIRKISEQCSLLRTSGKVDTAMAGASSRIKSIQSAIDRQTERLTHRQEYYERMFASLESNLSRLQSQNNWLSGQLSQFYASGG